MVSGIRLAGGRAPGAIVVARAASVERAGRRETSIYLPAAPVLYRLRLSVEKAHLGRIARQGRELTCEYQFRPDRLAAPLFPLVPEVGKHYVVTVLEQRDGRNVVPSDRAVVLGEWAVNLMPIAGPSSAKVRAVEFLIDLEQTPITVARRDKLLGALSGTNADLQFYALQKLRREALAKDEQERFHRTVRDALLGDTGTSPKVVVLADRTHAARVPQYAQSDERYERLLRVVRAVEFDPAVSNQALSVLVRMTGRRGALFTALMDRFEKRPDGAVLNQLFRSLFRNDQGRADRLSREILALSLRCLSHKESWARLNAADFLALESTAKALGELGRDAKDVLVQLKKAHAAEQNPLTKDALTRAIAGYEPERPERN